MNLSGASIPSALATRNLSFTHLGLTFRTTNGVEGTAVSIWSLPV
jgi:hypothetical protein